MTGMDCGGLVLVGARDMGLSDLEFLGYANFPTDGKFEVLLNENTDPIGSWTFPFGFNGSELKTGDLLSFDYGTGEGTRHLAIVTRWDGRRYRVLDALQDYGVSEHPLAAPLVTRRTLLKGWKIRGFAE